MSQVIWFISLNEKGIAVFLIIASSKHDLSKAYDLKMTKCAKVPLRFHVWNLSHRVLGCAGSYSSRPTRLPLFLLLHELILDSCLTFYFDIEVGDLTVERVLDQPHLY